MIVEKDMFNNTINVYDSKKDLKDKNYFINDKKVFILNADKELNNDANCLKCFVENEKKVNAFFLKKLDHFLLNNDFIFQNTNEKHACQSFIELADLAFKGEDIKMDAFNIIDKKLLEGLKT